MSQVEAADSGLIRFLVVDDSRAIQSIIRRTLEAGFSPVEIKVASDADSAMMTLQTFTPDLIITDWHMPKMSGLDFLKHLQTSGWPEMRVGFVTTESNPTKLDEARRFGARFVVNKPFDDQLFLEEVRKSLIIKLEEDIENEIDSSQFILQPKDCQKVLGSLLSEKHFKLRPALPVLPHFLTPHNLLGLYGFGGQKLPVTALAVMDMNTVAILWGISTGAAPEAVKSLSNQEDVDDPLLLIPRQWMELAGPQIRVTPDKAPLALTRSSIVAQGFKRLHDIMGNRDARADFSLSNPEYGKGHISFLMV